MSLASPHKRGPIPNKPDDFSEELTDWDQQVFQKLISDELSQEQIDTIVHPEETYPRQESVLAVHWHPESIPMDLIRRRIETCFPNRKHELIIPTQHNTLMTYGPYTGVEVDCYSPEFNRKVQLLVHFETERLEKADVFKALLAHTFKYRSRQLFELMDSITDPALADRAEQAASKTGADADLVEFVRVHTVKLRKLFDEHERNIPPDAYKNKILRFYLDAFRDTYDERWINHAQMFLKAVKQIVKTHFSLEYFYKTQEVIEEVRSLGGGIVIPHPEQFWPILLAEYDVDGYEVWNPQSQEYTEFLINVVHHQNKSLGKDQRPILIFMGDDCHMGEKIRPQRYQDPEKSGRQIGVQPAWDDLIIRKSLIMANANRRTLIEEYKSRLAG